MDGLREHFQPDPSSDPRGTWTLDFTDHPITLNITGVPPGLTGTIDFAGPSPVAVPATAPATNPATQPTTRPSGVPIDNVTLVGGTLSFTFDATRLGIAGIAHVTLTLGDPPSVELMMPDGDIKRPDIRRKAAATQPTTGLTTLPTTQPAAQPTAQPATQSARASFEPLSPLGPRDRSGLPSQPPTIVIGNVTVWTSGAAGVIAGGWEVVREGRIGTVSPNPIAFETDGEVELDTVKLTYVGPQPELSQAPAGRTVDVTGRHVYPGRITFRPYRSSC